MTISRSDLATDQQSVDTQHGDQISPVAAKAILVRQQTHLDFIEIVRARRKKNEAGYRLLADS